MKRILVVCAVATLCCSLVRAQEAEDSGSGAGLSIIPRAEIGALYDGNDKSYTPGFGNTSLYTLFEGNISPQWSFSVANHWLQADGWADAGSFDDALFSPSKDLYRFDNNASNLIDWAYITYAPGNFEFSLGKQMLLAGGFEFDEYDFNVNPFMASEFWNSFTCYQPAFSAAYSIPSIDSKITFQLATGPVGSASYALGWDGTYGPLSIKYSALSYKTQFTDDPRELLICLGHSLELGSFTLNLDYFNHCGDPNALCEEDGYVQFPAVKGHTVVGSLSWDAGEKWDAGIKCAFNGTDSKAPYGSGPDSLPRHPDIYDGADVYVLGDDEIQNLGTINGGVWVSWSPTADKEAFRIQAAAGVNSYNYDQGEGSPFLTIGAIWNFSFNLW